MRFGVLLLLALPLIASPLEDRIAAFKGHVYLYARNLDSGKSIGIDADERVRTASTIKLPILVGLHAAVTAGRVKMTDLLTLTGADKVSGSGVLHEFSDGVQLPVRDVANLMIVVSDNTATNLILDRITADAVNVEMDKLGLPNTRSNRKVRGDGAQLKPPSGWSEAGKREENAKFGLGVSTPREMVTLLALIEKGEVISPQASREILALLKRQQDQDCIRRRMQKYEIANKTGALDALRSDVGIVYTPKGRIAIAITCDGIPEVDYGPNNAGALLIADLAPMLVDLLAN